MATLARLFLRKDVAATWQSANPTLGAGEAGFETDQFRLRIGNGALAFNALRAFLSVPTGAITVAQTFLNATTQANQRAALGITGLLAALNSIGGVAQAVTDLDDVHSLGSGIYVAGGGAANNPDGTTITGIYTKTNATEGQFIGVGALGGINPPRLWVRNRAAGVWGTWQSWAGNAFRTTDWNAASTPGFWWSDDTAANSPGALYFSGITVARSSNDAFQLLLQNGGDWLTYRRKAAGVWSTWRRVIDTGNLAASFAALPYVSTEQTITSGGLLTLAHGLGAAPSLITLSLICKVADAGYAVGDIITAEAQQSAGASARVTQPYAGTVNVFVRFSPDAAGAFVAGHKTTGAAQALNNTSWRLIVRAYP